MIVSSKKLEALLRMKEEFDNNSLKIKNNKEADLLYNLRSIMNNEEADMETYVRMTELMIKYYYESSELLKFKIKVRRVSNDFVNENDYNGLMDYINGQVESYAEKFSESDEKRLEKLCNNNIKPLYEDLRKIKYKNGLFNELKKLIIA